MLNSIRLKFRLLGISFKNTYLNDTAYFFENWASVLSTCAFMATLLVFIQFLYANVDSFAGYSQNEMLFLILVGQMNFYLDWLWITNNIQELMGKVSDGSLDLILVKPLPSLFYVSTRRINVIARLRDALPNILILLSLIKWQELQVTWQRVLIGIFIFILGQIAWQAFRFLFSLPVFFVGKSKNLFQISGILSNTLNIPFEGFMKPVRIALTSIAPTLIASQLSVSVMLGKSNPALMLAVAVAVTIVFSILRRLGWNYALANYTSASS